ncbi:class I tRNA ligase family protein [Bacteroides ovatus]|nr:class I tRNA ligase family protein [Bacteroides ovatus]
MEKKFKRTTVTSALPYANGPVHIGHLAGVYVPADIYVRYLRLKKKMYYSSEVRTNTECLSPSVPRKKELLHRM